MDSNAFSVSKPGLAARSIWFKDNLDAKPKLFGKIPIIVFYALTSKHPDQYAKKFMEILPKGISLQ